MIRRHKGPRRRRWHELRDKRRRGIVLLPSLLTTGNLFCGFFALLLTVEGRYTDAALAIFVAMIMDLLDGRARGATICPSEAARAVGGDDWRPLMEPARAAARRLVARGLVEITQSGRVVDGSTAKGPIRIRRTSAG